MEGRNAAIFAGMASAGAAISTEVQLATERKMSRRSIVHKQRISSRKRRRIECSTLAIIWLLDAEALLLRAVVYAAPAPAADMCGRGGSQLKFQILNKKGNFRKSTLSQMTYRGLGEPHCILVFLRAFFLP